MDNIKPLKIGELVAKYPIVQGGMGVGISLSSLAGNVAKQGGVGIISTAQIGFRNPLFETSPIEANMMAIKEEFDKAREISPTGIIGFNIMVATRYYAQYVKAAVKAGADIIISGAGLPVDLPELIEGAKTKIAPIVSTAKSATVICKLWDRKYHRVPDMVVIEGPLAGGHLGFSNEQLTEYGADTEEVKSTYKSELYDAEIKGIVKVVRQFEEKYNQHIPVIVAGGIYDQEDVNHALDLGADGVQVSTRFVTTEECDAPDAYKQAYINAEKEDIVITKSPVGMPGRAIRNTFLDRLNQNHKEKISKCYQCIVGCNPATIPYCITNALRNAALGNVDEALLFCGSNAYRATKIETVEEVMKSLVGQV